MAFELTEVSRSVQEMGTPFGVANEKRGANYRNIAVEFAKMYPIGTVILMSEFDEFAISFGGIAPPSCTEKGSEGWLAFMQRRHQFKTNINKASAHPDMERLGVSPFVVEQEQAQKLVVKTPYDAATKNRMGKQLASLLETKQRRLKHLMQSVDYAALPPLEQVKVGMLAGQVHDFERRIRREIGDLEEKFNDVRSGISGLLKDGRVVPQNGGIKALMDLSDETADQF
jgi:hypothetical protein